MDQVVNDFVHVLRGRGLRISPAESIDGLRALTAVGLASREQVRDSLRATLVKSVQDAETFDRLFETYFGLGELHREKQRRLALDEHDHGAPPSRIEVGEDWEEPESDQRNDSKDHSHDEGESPNLRRFFDQDRLRASSSSIHADPNRMRLSLFSQELILNRRRGAMDGILQRISHHLRVRRARGILTPGPLVAHCDGDEIPLDIVATELRDLVSHLHELGVDEALLANLETQAANIFKGLPALIEAMRQRQRGLAPNHGQLSQIQRKSLVRMMSFSAGDERALKMAIRRLTRRIYGARTRRMRQDRIGRISMAHTLRKNMGYGGVPFQPVLRRRREQRPRLVVLCDLSLSTRNLARFWLHLLYQMHSLFSKVRTFAFVAEMLEVTPLFAAHGFERAVEEVFEGRLLDVDVNSDFGRAVAQFRAEHASAVTRRTTLVILGDGRNNGRPPNIPDFEEISRNARRVIWMTPEPRWGWSLGSCDMPLYEPLCQRVEIVRNVEQLAKVAEALFDRNATIR